MLHLRLAACAGGSGGALAGRHAVVRQQSCNASQQQQPQQPQRAQQVGLCVPSGLLARLLSKHVLKPAPLCVTASPLPRSFPSSLDSLMRSNGEAGGPSNGSRASGLDGRRNGAMQDSLSVTAGASLSRFEPRGPCLASCCEASWGGEGGALGSC